MTATEPGITAGKAGEITDLVAGYRAWSDSASITVDSRTQAPAATTTFCAFTVSYLASRATVSEGC
ncbi:hypothetical protein JL107_09855 [Nakamurella flavida]|uniref:Uncharacterized protein n=1 Tax=Nakamurella flavida TaxID=363630 RepID=A0A938YL81_9ACTN|nr:hypothetical protein [Nakamurella flavida]MBM9476748.1 hypothetical protein [Nakamurella flavida]MDP9778814.1 hypothetical protein [Nakamurella flavida]